VAKKNPEQFVEILSVVSHSLYAVSVMAWPIMPDKMETLLGLIGCSIDPENENCAARLSANEWSQKFDFAKPETALFPRVESQLEPEEPVKPVPAKAIKTVVATDESHITIDDLCKGDLHVGKIESCEPVKGSKKLYKMQVSFGEKMGNRQILAGIAEFYEADYLVGCKANFVTNLKPRKLMGLLSEGMMLCAKDDAGNFSITGLDREIEPGTKLS
jgi:methionyl-tRNA synthetase